MRITRRLAISFAGVLVALAAAPNAHAINAPTGWFGSNYSFGDDQCNGISDPVDTVFYGSSATGDYLTGGGKGHIYYHTGWSDHTGESDQWQESSNSGIGCAPSLTFQPAESFGALHSRYHMRMFDPQVNDRKGRKVLLATTHHEDWVQSCNNFRGNHAIDKGAKDRGKAYETDKGSGFDQGRRKLVTRFKKDPKGGNSRHPISYADWGNTTSKKQCDGEYAGSNGLVAWIGVGKT